jgi:hypothetical protein
MNKLCTAILLLLCLITEVQAQNENPLGHRMGLQLGSAVPAGAFGKNSFEDEHPVMARSGIMAKGFYARDLTAGVALGGTIGWRSNSFDLDEFAREDDALVLSREATAWQTGFAVADVYLQSRAGNFLAYFKGSLGGASNKSAGLQVNTRYGAITRTSDSAFSLAYGVAGGVGAQIDRIGLSLEIGGLLTRPTFEVADAQGQRIKYKQAMQTVNVSFGLAYTL